MTIGIYFAFITFVIGTILAKDEDVTYTDKDLTDFVRDICKAHNHYRKKHGLNPLKLDKEICDATNKYIEEWKENPSKPFPDKYGLVYVRSKYDKTFKLNANKKFNGLKIIGKLYNKVTNYNYLIEPPSPETTKDFTQILWRSTEKLGVGIVINNGKFELFLTYSPPGNIPGQYVKNVPKPIKDDDSNKKLLGGPSSDIKKKLPGETSSDAKIKLPGATISDTKIKLPGATISDTQKKLPGETISDAQKKLLDKTSSDTQKKLLGETSSNTKEELFSDTSSDSDS